MKIIEVKTWDEAFDNIYPSDKDFKGIIFHVKGE